MGIRWRLQGLLPGKGATMRDFSLLACWLLACWMQLAIPLNALSQIGIPSLEATLAGARETPAVVEQRIYWPSADDQLLRDRLERTRVSFNHKEIRFADAIDLWRRELEVTILLDPAGLEEAGVAHDQIVELVIRDMPAKAALFQFLDLHHLTLVVRNGAVKITSSEIGSEQLTTRLYNIRDLVDYSAEANEKEAAPRPPLPVPPGARVVWPPDKEVVPNDRRWRAAADEIVDAIESLINADSWVHAGGTGSIMIYRGMLMVSQTDDVHEDIMTFLTQLRRAEVSKPGDIFVVP
jgi:hypothetical protein